jgi:hypothetical protein
MTLLDFPLPKNYQLATKMLKINIMLIISKTNIDKIEKIKKNQLKFY